MRTLLMLAAALCAVSAQSQENVETLLKANTAFPAQGGPGAKLAYLGGSTGILMGGRGAVMLGENMALGVAGYSLASEVVTSLGGVKRDISFSYVGITVDNYFLSRRLLFLNTSVLVGPGFATGSQRNPAADKDRTMFFVVEPEFNVMLNVTREIRIGLGVAYRLTAGSEIGPVVGADLGGISANLSLLYGRL